jgi:hypothetical protein
MAKKKTETIPSLELLTKAFMEDVNDGELQERYDRFIIQRDRTKEKYNEIVPVINELVRKKNVLHATIFALAIEGIISIEANTEYKKINAEFVELEKEVLHLKEAMETNEELITKYQNGSNDKLFHWWRAFKAIDSEGTAPWIEWKTPYENKII